MYYVSVSLTVCLSVCRDCLSVSFQYDVLEMDQFTHTLVPFPLLASHSDYFPDTQDLTVDTEARDYWLNCFEDGLDKVSFAFLFVFFKGLLANPLTKLFKGIRKAQKLFGQPQT